MTKEDTIEEMILSHNKKLSKPKNSCISVHPGDLAKSIEQYVTKARIEELERIQREIAPGEIHELFEERIAQLKK